MPRPTLAVFGARLDGDSLEDPFDTLSPHNLTIRQISNLKKRLVHGRHTRTLSA